MNNYFRVECKRPGTQSLFARRAIALATLLFCLFACSLPLLAQEAPHGGEANLVLPDLGTASFLGGISGRTLLLFGMGVGALGLVFGLLMYQHLQNLHVHE